MSDEEAGELPARTLFFKWEPSDEVDQRSCAKEMVASLFALTAGWLEPLALETYLGCYDRDILTTGPIRLAQPYHLLLIDPLPGVRIAPLYRSVEERRDVVGQESVFSWIEGLLGQPCGDPARYETSLRRLLVQASSTKVPRRSAATDSMVLKCYAGHVEVPMERRGEVAWISGPPVIAELPQPVAIGVANLDGRLRLTMEVFWSPWLADLEDAGGMLQQGIARLVARGWVTSTTG